MKQCKILNLPKITDDRGNLTFLQNNGIIPFDIKRVFWTYNVPGGEIRGGHAYKNQKEIIIALSGSLDVIITQNDGNTIKYCLNRSYYGLYLPPNTWRHLENFSTNALSFHITNCEFDANDYIRDFEKIKLTDKK